MGQRLQWLQGEKGQGLVEYALLLSIVALGVIISLGLLGTNLNEVFGEIAEAFGKGGGGQGWGQGMGGGRFK